VPTSGAFVTNRLLRAGTQPARNPPLVLSLRCSRRDRSHRASTSLTSSIRLEPRPSAPSARKAHPSVAARTSVIVSISRRARASTHRRSDDGCCWPRLRSPPPLPRLTVRSRSRAIDRAVSERRHSLRSPDELGPLPLAGRRRLPLGRSSTRGAHARGDPGPFDRCLQLTIRFSKNDRPVSRHTPQRTSPRVAGAIGVTPMGSLRRAGLRSEACSASVPHLPAYL
jgi:hypothetical protein